MMSIIRKISTIPYKLATWGVRGAFDWLRRKAGGAEPEAAGEAEEAENAGETGETEEEDEDAPDEFEKFVSHFSRGPVPGSAQNKPDENPAAPPKTDEPDGGDR